MLSSIFRQVCKIRRSGKTLQIEFFLLRCFFLRVICETSCNIEKKSEECTGCTCKLSFYATPLLQIEYLLAKIGLDTAENEPLKIWGYLSHTYLEIRTLT